MRLSIIIPAYNVEQYLERCVYSCENQDISKDDYEIIIVNDGSPDNSLQIAENLALKYSNIVVISQENQGLSGARNTGMNNARGKYLWFVDSDDYIVKNCIGRVLELCTVQEADICHFSLGKYENGKLKLIHQHNETDKLLPGREMLLHHTSIVLSSVCAKFYKKDFLQRNNLSFVEGITQQDVELNARAYALTSRCLFVSDPMYIVNYTPDSIRRSPKIEKRIKYVKDTAKVAALTKQFYMNKISDIQLKGYMLKNINSRVAGCIYNMVKYEADDRIVEAFIGSAKEYGIYPIKGQTLSLKWNSIRFILNNQKLWCFLKFL